MVALGAGNSGKADPGVAGSWFHDGVARLKLAFFFCLFNHGQGNPVLDRAAGVEEFQLDVDVGSSFWDDPV